MVQAAFVAPFTAAVTSLQYVDQRIRKEAFDVELMTRAGITARDPRSVTCRPRGRRAAARPPGGDDARSLLRRELLHPEYHQDNLVLRLIDWLSRLLDRGLAAGARTRRR